MVKGQPVLRQSLDIGSAGTITIKFKVVDGVIL